MAEKTIPHDCKFGFHGNTSCSVPSMFSPPLLINEEAQHLVYVFCDNGDNPTKSRHKHRYQRRYCSLCRHFHQENEYKEGFEKNFSSRETPKNYRTGRSEEKMALRTSEAGSASSLQTNVAFGSVENAWKTLSVEGLKLYKTAVRSTQKSLSRQPEPGEVEDFHHKGESAVVSARSGCKVCVKRIDSAHKKKIIKIVVPPFD